MAQPDSPLSLQACALRIARLASTGAPVVGAGNGYMTNQFVKVTWKPEVEAGVEFAIRNACGSLVTTYRDRDIVKRYAIDLEFQVPDPEVHELLVGAGIITGSGNSIGHTSPPLGTNPNTYNFGSSIELWTKAIVGSQQAAAATAWLRWVFPACYLTLGEKNAENADMKVNFTGYFTEPTALYQSPWADFPASLGQAAGGLTRAYAVFRDSQTNYAAVAQAPGYVSVPA